MNSTLHENAFPSPYQSDSQMPPPAYGRDNSEASTEPQKWQGPSAKTEAKQRARKLAILIFRRTSIIVSAIGCAMYGGAAAFQENISTDMSFGIIDLITIGPLAFSFLFSSLFIGIPYLHRLRVRHAKHRDCNSTLKPLEPPHPAISVSFDLLAWLYLGAMFIMLCLFQALDYSYNWCRTGVDESTCRTSGQGARALEIIGFTCIIISMICHFVLFVYACRDTQRLNKRIKELLKRANQRGDDIEL